MLVWDDVRACLCAHGHTCVFARINSEHEKERKQWEDREHKLSEDSAARAKREDKEHQAAIAVAVAEVDKAHAAAASEVETIEREASRRLHAATTAHVAQATSDKAVIDDLREQMHAVEAQLLDATVEVRTRCWCMGVCSFVRVVLLAPRAAFRPQALRWKCKTVSWR